MKNEGISRQLCELYTVLGDAEIPDAERTFRKQHLQRAADLSNQDPFANTFFQLAHEIRSLAFLPQYGNTRMAYDSKHEGGADFVVMNGPDEQFVSGLAMGATGGIGGTYAVMPELFIKARKLFYDGKVKDAYLVQLISEGKLDPTPLFNKEYTLNEIAQVYEDFAVKRDGLIKPVIKPYEY